MSSARICDVRRNSKCLGTFSELEEGWQSFQGSTIRTNALTGRRESIVLPLDACPNCAVAGSMIQESALERLVRKLEGNPQMVQRLLDDRKEEDEEED